MTPNLKQNGFTLLEIIIALAVSMVLFTVIVNIYQISQMAYRRTDNLAEITQNGRVILDRLIRELRQTQDIVTDLPLDASDPDALPHEIMFQDGHNSSQIQYLRYYLDGTDIKRQIITYEFAAAPGYLVHWYDTDVSGNPPAMSIVEDRLVGEYASDIEFWGDKLVYINLYLAKNDQTEVINTAVSGRNL